MQKDQGVINLFRPMELIGFSLFPLIGHIVADNSLPPLMLVFSSLILSLAIIFDNYVEGVLFHPGDARSGDYPVTLSPGFFQTIRFGREVLFAVFFLITVLAVPRSLPWAMIVFILIRLYNSRHFVVKMRPPLDFLCHYFGAFVFYMYGVSWQGHSPGLVLPGLGLAALFSGGYLNHLLVDRLRDAELGLVTLVHRFKENTVHYLAGGVIVAGDLCLSIFYAPTDVLWFLVFALLALSIVIMIFVLKNARAFRRYYRLLHIMGASIILMSIWFWS
ncbi:hypothetical protein JXQ70_11920 [bacterium]|nr:hypothetical protein [bacterium]